VSRITRPLVFAALSLAWFAAPAAAQPGHGHDHQDHGHGAHVKPTDMRKVVVGDWQVDVEATLDADPEMKAAAAADGALDTAREMFGETRLRFTPDGRATARFPDGRREGVYTVAPTDGGRLTIRIVDAHDNRLNTADYDTTLTDGRMVMRHDGTTLVFVRPGAVAAAKPALDRAQARPILGRWQVDVPRTLSADPRLETMTAEQRKAAREGAQAFLSKVAFEWRPDGSASIAMGERIQENQWRLVGREGDRYTLDVRFAEAGPAGDHETLVLQLDGAYMRMTMGPQVLVLVRAQ